MTPYAQSLYEAVRVPLEAGRSDEAIALLKQAVASGADDAFFLYVLGNCQFKAGDYAEAAAALTASVRLLPTQAEAFNDLAAALFVLGRDAEALTCLRRALDLRPGLPEAEETDAIWLLRYGRFREGWRKYEARFDTHANKGLRRPFSQPQWRGEPLGGRTILLHAEQGLGDALQFVRYAPLVAARNGRVILGVYPGMRPLLSKMPGIGQIVDTGGPLPPFDLHCSLMSLPLAFGTEMDSIPATIPYLTVPEDRLAGWRARLGPRRGLRVGIAWSGNPEHRDDARRSIPFEAFSALLADRPGIEFHVVQTQLRAADEKALKLLPHVRNHAPRLLDFADTGALVSLMDIVISVDTAVVHLAGALDRPVWLLLAHLADWRWLLERDDSPWYPSLWLLRQPERGDWATVLSTIAEQLQEMLA
jgi:Tetratricopeptide repeat/Glycosyltransferase family 9 (heptosyltransferase)